jgi:hypothetical protein
MPYEGNSIWAVADLPAHFVIIVPKIVIDRMAGKSRDRGIYRRRAPGHGRAALFAVVIVTLAAFVGSGASPVRVLASTAQRLGAGDFRYGST